MIFGIDILHVFGWLYILGMICAVWFLIDYCRTANAGPSEAAAAEGECRAASGGSPTPVPVPRLRYDNVVTVDFDPTDALFDPLAIARNQRIDWPDTVEPIWLPEALDSKRIH